MSEHARLLQALYQELMTNGFDADPESYVQGVNENLEELQRAITRPCNSRLQTALYAESGYWLYRIRELADSRRYGQEGISSRALTDLIAADKTKGFKTT